MKFCSADSLKVPFKTAKLKVPVELLPWPTHCAERVGVNSFGIGGANAHVSPEKIVYIMVMLKIVYRSFWSLHDPQDLTHELRPIKVVFPATCLTFLPSQQTALTL